MQNTTAACSAKSDVVFVIDSSDAVSATDYQKELDFVRQTVSRWDVQPNGVQVGLVSFGSSARGVFNLNTHPSGQAVVTALGSAPSVGGKANLQEALRYATDTMFTPQSGVRGDSSKIVVMVTNGQSPNKDLTIVQGETTKAADIQIYTVGVGQGINTQELSGTASSPSSRYFYTADTFDSTGALADIIGPKICNEVPHDASFLPQPTGCLQKADVVFLLDSSSSIGKDNFRKMEDFLKDVVQDLNVSPDGVHVGLMQYSSYPSMEFPLNMHSSRFDVLKAIDNVRFIGGGANTADALEYMRRLGFSQNSGARTDVPRIAIVLTDGSSPNSAQVAIQANNARMDNIGLISVGVGSSINTAELQAIADDPDSSNMFTVRDFNNLPSITKQLIDATCNFHTSISSVPSGTQGPDPCQDKVNCPGYGKEVCTVYAQWSQVNCQRYCGFCDPIHTTPAPPCDDQLSDCASYGVSSCTGLYKGWAQQNCRRYCSYCGESATSNGFYGKCYYKGRTYQTGEKWMDGCDYECVCEDGNTGKYRCYNRCPIYHNLPTQCTLVQDPDQCCMQPRCYFQQSVNTVQGSTVGSYKGVSTCEYKGQNYFQNQQWQDGCDFQCTCTDAQNGHYECHDLCPTYSLIPSYCHLEKEAGSCCAKPVCEFDMQQGSFTGLGSVTGDGIDSIPPTLPPCVDKIPNCAMYGKATCTNEYRTWALQNCRQFCQLCDVCIYQGTQYHQGDTWNPECNLQCTCEKATQGYYRCQDTCPSYTNVPPTCQLVRKEGACCPTLQCGSGTFISSTNNLYTIGNGGTIYTGGSYVPPTLVSGSQAPPGVGDAMNHASSIPGCLYKGEVYVQGQRWNDGCDLSCDCLDASTGRYRCRARCPQYLSLPTGCTLVMDEADTCCQKPHCTGPAAQTYIPNPIYGQYVTKANLAQPPSVSQRFPPGGGVFGPGNGHIYFVQNSSTVAAPTVGPHGSGGIGYCTYKGQTYQQDDKWEDGCLYNCVCDDASLGHYTCIDKCVIYDPSLIPQPYCHLEQDPNNHCCKIPVCQFTAPYEKVTGVGVKQPSTVGVHTTVVPSPTFNFCQFNGKTYDKGQIWYQGCDFKCTCEDTATNNYRCVSRCPEYENLDPSCTFEPDPEDPTCCSIPRCGTPAPQNTLVPNPTDGVVTVPPRFVTGDNFPPGVTGGTHTGYCEYNGQRYQQGETWEDGCQYNCVCEDVTTGKYKCNEKCPIFETVPDGCRLVTDFTNPCCKTVRCDPNAGSGTPLPGTTGKPNPNNPTPTSAPNPNAFCVYHNAKYRQDEEWTDGCDKTCRCDNADTGLYTCTTRCMTYKDLPAECALVTDPDDQCCLVPQCGVPTATPTQGPEVQAPIRTPPPGQPTLTPPPQGATVTPSTRTTSAPGVFSTPTAIPGIKIFEPVYPTPTVGPNGETAIPTPRTYCEYKGARYQQSETWTDGCDFTCECKNALTGSAECKERCPRYVSLPPECRLVKNPADPCCEMPECGPSPTSPSATGSPVPTGGTITPGMIHSQSPGVNILTTPSPHTTMKDVCVYKGKTYSQGQTWFDGCDYKCVCENGVQGLYTCNDRCPVFDQALPTGCTMVADPNDPFCCKTPECTLPPHFANSTGFLLPTPPLAVVGGGSATPLPTPPQNGHQSPSPGTLLTPQPGQPTSTPMPTIPNNVCVYNGRVYQQGQSWRDGCNFNCRCEDAKYGHYQCTEVCPKNPPTLPAGCYLVRDPTNPCCQRPYCDFTKTTTHTQTPAPGTTLHPPTGPTVNPPTPGVSIPTTTPKPAMCVYNGVPFAQGATWDDGCDLKCVCENATTGYYRCNQRCARYDHVRAGCTLVADPRDSCCRVPLCPPVVTTPNPATLTPPKPGSTLVPTTPGMPVIPTIIGKVEGVGVEPTPGVTEKPNPNNPFPTPKPTKAPGCLYKGVMYRQGQQFSDGCQYDCVCVDDMTGRYTCTEKCPVYPSLPPNCQLVNDPTNPCCKTAQCLTTPHLVTPAVGSTLTAPPQGHTVTPGTHTTPAPVKRDVCTYNGKTYTQGQRWDDGCTKVCVCENANTGFYRCSDRCANYDPIPAGCTLVADPNDPLCCQVPQCAPTANPQYPNPTSGPTVIVTQPTGRVTGTAPVPHPHHRPPRRLHAQASRARNNNPLTLSLGKAVVMIIIFVTVLPVGCMYKGMIYRQTQQWQDGCDYKCVCVDEVTGAYSCTQRCPPTGPVQPRCSIQPDPNDYCCVRQVCDFSKPTPTPQLPPELVSHTTRKPLPSGQTYPPTVQPPTPGVLTTPKPTSPSFCVYNGIPYQQGVSWKEGCSRTCRCEDAVNNYYSCFDRCPTYQLKAGCQLVTDPQDPCCQVPQCSVLVTPSPTPDATATPFPNGTYPRPTKGPDQVPVPVPTNVTGILTGTLNTPTGYCEYKGGRYTTGQKWTDGCDYNCECVDQATGMYRCTQKCPPHPNIPPYCVMVSDPNDACCETPYCPGLLTPAPKTTPGPTNPPTVSPGTGPTGPTGPTPSPGTGPTVRPPSTSPSTSSPPSQSTQTPPPVLTFPTFNVPIPTGTSNPVPKDVCVFMGKAYTQGQQWYDGCDKICVCEDGSTGFYSCTDRCAVYPNIAPGCVMVADPKDPLCCKAPQCSPPTNPNVPPTGVIGVVTGSGLPIVPTPSPGGPIPTQPHACVYKGNTYKTGESWQDGCDFTCTCIDDMTGQFKCTDRCEKYPNLPTTCVMVYNPSDPCCKVPRCGDNRPTTPPTLAPTTDANGNTPPLPTTVSPNAFCVYNGVPYRQGQTWQVGCDKVCKCEDAATRQVTCTDRCPSFPVIQDGCMLKTDPLDTCCQILDCPPVLQPGTDILVPPVRGVVNGGKQNTPIGGRPSNFGGPSTCLYNGKSYRQGQTWDDGCSYTCVCVDELAGKYRCSEKCPRYDNLAATCTLVPDPKDPCCKLASCPELVPSTQPPTGGAVTTPSGQTPTVGSTPVPPDVCVYGNNFYKQGQQWYDGCDKVCRCEDTSRNFYRCDERCAKFDNMPAGCTMVPDPRDPTCCKIPDCPLVPVGGVTPTVSGFLRPSVTPQHGVFTGDGKIPSPLLRPTKNPGDSTPIPLPKAGESDSTLIPLPKTGCYYKNVVYHQGQSWDDGCDYTCQCVDERTGAYRCTDKCPPVSNKLPDPTRCRLLQDPKNPCCAAPYCDFVNPTPSFPTPSFTPSVGPTGNVDYFTAPPLSGTKPPVSGYCVYQGAYYQQGQTWEVGCTQVCRCEDVTTGYYSCSERCKSFDNLPAECQLKPDPKDPCCVVPDCNVYANPNQPFTNGPHGETPLPPTNKPVPVVGGTFTGLGGTNPLGINPVMTNTQGSRKECVYKGVAYSQGMTWKDGCDFICECIDANRGQYRCSDRCPAMYFLPQGCFKVPDPQDQCCLKTECSGTPPTAGITTPTAPYNPTTNPVITAAPDQCVYRDNSKYHTGDTWNDGCSLSCKCEDGSQNKYTCTQRCELFTLPDYCHLEMDPQDHCCQRPTCRGHLTPLVSTGKATAAPFLPANETNIVPVGTHTVISGRSPVTPGYRGPALTGGRNACIYKNKPYYQGQTWDDGCDYACVCNNAVQGDYTCTTKCPRMPPLPQYCTSVAVPGQCCRTVTCQVPDHGTYTPLPELTGGELPTPGPTQQPHGHGHHENTTPFNQVLVPNQPGTITGGEQLPGGGQLVPSGYRDNIGGLLGKCVTKDLHMYNPGETWDVGCTNNCTCLDGRTGYYRCDPMCPKYSSLPSDCVLVKEGCCEHPLCTKPDGTTINLTKNPDASKEFPVAVSYPTTDGFTGFRPGYLGVVPNTITGQTPGCVYKGSLYATGDTWDDGCDFTCRCEDAHTRQFICKPRCTKYTSVPATCNLVKDPQGCCDVLNCTQQSATVNPACKDPLDNCQDYGHEACVGQYEPWARRHCPHYCGYETCGDSTTPAPVCADKLPNCNDYEDDACQGAYLSWAKQNCQKRCNLCPQPATHAPNTCFDVLPDCVSYGTYACQPPYTEWARENCNQTCGFCSKAVSSVDSGFSGHNKGTIGVVGGQGSQIGAMSQPGWVTLMKGVHGVPNDDLFQLWASSETRNANNSLAMAPTADFPGNFKSPLSNYWDSCKFQQIKVAVWNEGQEKANIIFDARNTDKMSWFDPQRIISSTYNDLRGASFNFFDMRGDASMGREFFINKDSSSCAGNGWIMVSTQNNCFYERAGSKPTFYYAKGDTAGSWPNRAEGDVFMISGHGGSCYNNTAAPGGRPVCRYKGQEYSTGETWQDGCQKNCTCRDGNLGYYQCDDLCRVYQTPLPQGCQLIKKPGECCQSLQCNVHPGDGCYYHGTFYHQGDVWDDGCDYRCTCEDASSGFYTCKLKCLTWNLPNDCYLASPAAGKCCPVPKCPAGFVISYPPGYQEE
ncbi:uncharacterized protein LOC143300296 [Babylonia areolata]|uniref:uncharacterized protein LOC143300296 n=1 Tax=Babylonia areolata TaxID=304850 RepID=UPI003FCFCA29